MTDTWAGQWTGPEATFLRITGSGGNYELVIQDLDGPKTFNGVAVPNGIEFERAGTRFHIRKTDGVGTGMKWLTEKQDCLVVQPSEGYCRD